MVQLLCAWTKHGSRFECNISHGVHSETQMVGRRVGRGYEGSRKGGEGIDIHELSIVRGTDIIPAGKVRAAPSDTAD